MLIYPTLAILAFCSLFIYFSRTTAGDSTDIHLGRESFGVLGDVTTKFNFADPIMFGEHSKIQFRDCLIFRSLREDGYLDVNIYRTLSDLGLNLDADVL